MNMFEELLAQYGLKREQLSAAEAETLRGWANQLASTTLSVHDIGVHVEAMCETIEREMCEPPKTVTDWLFRKKRQAHLMARLQNYLMLRDFITKPERARKLIEEQLKRVAPEL